MYYGQTNVPMEFSLVSARVYRDIFNEVDVDVLFTDPDDKQWRVPAFWAGDNMFSGFGLQLRSQGVIPILVFARILRIPVCTTSRES